MVRRAPPRAEGGLILDADDCPHLPEDALETRPNQEACSVCGIPGPLRMCVRCGEALCCTSRAGHNRDHWQETGHPVIREMPLREGSFLWCWECDAYLE